jgi:hypothetical protein
MRRQLSKQTLKLRLLALVLALALVWYSLHPVAGSATICEREDKLPEGERREAGPRLQRAALLPVVVETKRAELSGKPIANRDEDDFDWPEFIDG